MLDAVSCKVIHKPNAPIRPIISKISTYKTAKYLNGILSEKIKDDEFVFKDSFDFINRLNNVLLEKDQVMISFELDFKTFKNCYTYAQKNLITVNRRLQAFF